MKRIIDHKHYVRWHSAKYRCHNKSAANYEYYGGRGIAMSEEFRNDSRAYCEYVDSLPGYDEGKTIDRIDNNKGYERGNLQWATPREQQLNTRRDRMGYCYCSHNEKYKVSFSYMNKMYNFGYYVRESDASATALQLEGLYSLGYDIPAVNSAWKQAKGCYTKTLSLLSASQ